MWAEKSIWYHIYPLGCCGAPQHNDGKTVDRIRSLLQWIPHLQKLGITTVYFSPVFQSDSHGYDTCEYHKIDCRLGSNQDFATVCHALKAHNIRIVLDGVFNHVGRGFWAFQDVLHKRESSVYASWFYICFNGNSPYNDGFSYEGWEEHYELVKLNLNNEAVIEYLFSAINLWIRDFDIDGLRLDVAYCLDEHFLKRLRQYCTSFKEDFFLMGEIIHGDYNRLIASDKLHSVTNYECYKGIYSSCNDLNCFEIEYSLNRQFAFGGLYTGKHLYSFVDNHDVSRIASVLKNKNHLPLAYALLFGMPGIPSLYYGSEWAETGLKSDGDEALRPYKVYPHWNTLSDIIACLAQIRLQSNALCHGSYYKRILTNQQFVFERSIADETVLVAINLSNSVYTIDIPECRSGMIDMMCNTYTQSNTYSIPAYDYRFFKIL